MGVDPTSGKKGPYVVCDHDSLSDALKERNALNKLVNDFPSIHGWLHYKVHDDRGMERGYVIGESQWSHAFFCGVHSNMPLCCVLWYCDAWVNNLSGQLRLYSKIEFEYCPENPSYPLQIKKSQSPRYNMCPDCLAGYLEGRIKPARIKSCGCGGKPLWPPKGKFKVIVKDYRTGGKYTEVGIYDSLDIAKDKSESLTITRQVESPLGNRLDILVSAFVLDEDGDHR